MSIRKPTMLKRIPLPLLNSFGIEGPEGRAGLGGGFPPDPPEGVLNGLKSVMMV
ncbi:MAG: hypothetical protein QF745_00370 [Planctomycetota bacterium]|nr:hypothetical protein [Planctomycetota bacterium]